MIYLQRITGDYLENKRFAAVSVRNRYVDVCCGRHGRELCVCVLVCVFVCVCLCVHVNLCVNLCVCERVYVWVGLSVCV